MLVAKLPAIHAMLCPAASCRLASRWQARQSVCACTVPRRRQQQQRCCGTDQRDCERFSCLLSPNRPHQSRERKTAAVPSGSRHLRPGLPASLLLLQRTNVRDDILDLRIGQLAGVGCILPLPFLVDATNCASVALIIAGSLNDKTFSLFPIAVAASPSGRGTWRTWPCRFLHRNPAQRQDPP